MKKMKEYRVERSSNVARLSNASKNDSDSQGRHRFVPSAAQSHSFIPSLINQSIPQTVGLTPMGSVSNLNPPSNDGPEITLLNQKSVSVLESEKHVAGESSQECKYTVKVISTSESAQGTQIM